MQDKNNGSGWIALAGRASISPDRARKKRLTARHVELWMGYGSYDVRGETALWRAVITQALLDAASSSAKAEDRISKTRARNWLLNGGRDFDAVCMLAEMDPQYVRKKSREALARNCVWRAAPGNSWRFKPRRKIRKSSRQESTPATTFFPAELTK